MRFTRRTRPDTRTVALAAALSLLLAACGGQADTDLADERASSDAGEAADPADDDAPADDEATDDGETIDEGDGLQIVTTTSILGDIVGQLVGDDAEVSVIMPPGADPHAYEPSAQDGAALREADLVVANGLLLEENLASVLEAVVDEGGNVLELADQLDPIDFDWAGPDDHRHDDGDDHGHDDGDDHGHAEGDEHGHDEDPHVWFDPIRMADGVGLIAAEIAAVDTTVDAGEWDTRAEDYAGQLLEVHEELETMFSAIPDEDRQLVTNHDALGYLAYRYDFEVLGTVIPGSSTQADADPRGFAELIATVEEADVTAVFAENTDSTVLAEQLASEVIGRGDLQIEVVPIYTDALGEEGSGAETYLGLLRTTGELITDALT